MNDSVIRFFATKPTVIESDTFNATPASNVVKLPKSSSSEFTIGSAVSNADAVITLVILDLTVTVFGVTPTANSIPIKSNWVATETPTSVTSNPAA